MIETMPPTHTLSASSASKSVTRVDTWMITFADLMALLLAFFVLIFSMSDFDARSWGDVVTSLSSDLKPLATGNPSQRASQAGFVQEPSSDGQTRAGYLKLLATRKFEAEISKGVLATELTNGSLHLHLQTDTRQSGLDRSLATSLAAFFETLQEPIDIIVIRSQTNNASRIQALTKGEAVFQQLRDVGYGGNIHIYETGSVTGPGQRGESDIRFSIRTGQR